MVKKRRRIRVKSEASASDDHQAQEDEHKAHDHDKTEETMTRSEKKKQKAAIDEQHHDQDYEKASQQSPFWMIVSIILSVVLVISIMTGGFSSFDLGKDKDQDTKDDPAVYDGETVGLTMHLMSKCSFGIQAVNAIAPVKEKLGDALDLRFEYILYPDTNYIGYEDQYCINGLCAMQGISEIQGNIVQVCAIKHEPDAYLEMITCMNTQPAQIPGNWENCASEAGLDVETIRECYEGEEGFELVLASSLRSQQAGATGSPTIFLDGKSYNGARSETDFLRVICEAFGSDAPDACQEVPKLEPVDLIVLSDSRCEDCDLFVGQLLSQLEMMIPNLEVTAFDYSSEQGRQLYEQAGFIYLPLLLFDESVMQASAYPQLVQYLQDQNGFKSLMIGSNFDPTKEICDNGIDDTGNGLVDCEDPDCKNSLICNPDAFVECAADFGISEESIIFYYSDSCGWCTMMKPGIETLEGEGYAVYSANAADPETNTLINDCFINYMDGGVPQFICLKKNEIKVGAFATQTQELDLNAMRSWFDWCIG